MTTPPGADWSNATREGSRRAQIRAALAMTVRERFEALDALAELAGRLASMRWLPAGWEPDGMRVRGSKSVGGATATED